MKFRVYCILTPVVPTNSRAQQSAAEHTRPRKDHIRQWIWTRNIRIFFPLLSNLKPLNVQRTSERFSRTLVSLSRDSKKNRSENAIFYYATTTVGRGEKRFSHKNSYLFFLPKWVFFGRFFFLLSLHQFLDERAKILKVISTNIVIEYAEYIIATKKKQKFSLTHTMTTIWPRDDRTVQWYGVFMKQQL